MEAHLVLTAGDIHHLVSTRWHRGSYPWASPGGVRFALLLDRSPAAVGELLVWQDLAVRQLGSGNTELKRQRLRDLDLEWESDFDLIPDREGVREFLHYRSRSSGALWSTGS